MSIMIQPKSASAVRLQQRRLQCPQLSRSLFHHHRNFWQGPRQRDEALLFLGDIRQRLTLVALEEVLRSIEASAGSITSAAIYDSLIGHCALKAKAEVLYTWNVKDFKAPEA